MWVGKDWGSWNKIFFQFFPRAKRATCIWCSYFYSLALEQQVSSFRSRLPHKSAKLMPFNDKLMSMNKKYTSNSIE